MPKVIVGMSGGVDSSVAAYLLKQQGYEVEGVSLILYEARNKCDFTACCSVEARDSASDTARALGIGHISLDSRGAFIDHVVGPFVEAYKNGLTPNPCILCNQYIKFPKLLEYAESAEAEFIATGHYAKVVSRQPTAFSHQLSAFSPQPSDRKAFLLKGVDPKKDQSYVLYVLNNKHLERLLLPLGDISKVEVRRIAGSLNLPAAERPESQEICFVENNDYNAFIKTLDPDSVRPGPIMSPDGRVLGTHKGIYAYTIGQRKGLSIQSPEPHFVTGIDPVNNIVYAGSRQDALFRKIHLKEMNWLVMPDSDMFNASVKVRSMMEARPATVGIKDGNVTVVFGEPQWAPAPGQSAVLYDGDLVLGGGTIVCSEK